MCKRRLRSGSFLLERGLHGQAGAAVDMVLAVGAGLVPELDQETDGDVDVYDEQVGRLRVVDGRRDLGGRKHLFRLSILAIENLVGAGDCTVLPGVDRVSTSGRVLSSTDH